MAEKLYKIIEGSIKCLNWLKTEPLKNVLGKQITTKTFMYNLYGYPEDKAWKEENHKTVFVTQYIAIDESWNEAVPVMSNIIPGVIRSVFFYPCFHIFFLMLKMTLLCEL